MTYLLGSGSKVNLHGALSRELVLTFSQLTGTLTFFLPAGRSQEDVALLLRPHCGGLQEALVLRRRDLAETSGHSRLET